MESHAAEQDVEGKPQEEKAAETSQDTQEQKATAEAQEAEKPA